MFGIVVLKRVFVSGFGCVLPGCRCFTSSELARRKFWRQASSSVPWVAVDRPMSMLQPPGFSVFGNVTAARHNLKKARFEKATEGKDVV